jgi:hypothetical protein
VLLQPPKFVCAELVTNCAKPPTPYHKASCTELAQRQQYRLTAGPGPSHDAHHPTQDARRLLLTSLCPSDPPQHVQALTTAAQLASKPVSGAHWPAQLRHTDAVVAEAECRQQCPTICINMATKHTQRCATWQQHLLTTCGCSTVTPTAANPKELHWLALMIDTQSSHYNTYKANVACCPHGDRYCVHGQWS